MRQTEIPIEQWQTFCDQFSRQHHSWIVNVSVSDSNTAVIAEIGAEEAERRMRPLSRAVVFDAIAIEPHYCHNAVSILVGAPPGEVAHLIDNPRRLFFRHTEEGAHEGLVVESGSGQTALLRFRAAALPETLDGLADTELEPEGLDTS
jgi:hypothetical protein